MQIRHITEADRAMLLEWIAEDPDHRGRVTPDFFIPPDTEKDPEAAADWANRVTSCVFSDHTGPVIFSRFSTAMRTDVQFKQSERVRTAIMLPVAFNWLLERAEAAHFSQMIFDSTNPRLIDFVGKRFGFTPSPNELIARLA